LQESKKFTQIGIFGLKYMPSGNPAQLLLAYGVPPKNVLFQYLLISQESLDVSYQHTILPAHL
jgi:hypothetical protein